MHNSSLVAIAQYFWRIRTSVLYGNQKKFNTEAVNDYPPIRFEIRFERKFLIVGLYFFTLPVETLWNLCPVEKLFGMRMAGLGQFYWRTCFLYFFLGMQNLSTDLALRLLNRFCHTIYRQIFTNRHQHTDKYSPIDTNRQIFMQGSTFRG